MKYWFLVIFFMFAVVFTSCTADEVKEEDTVNTEYEDMKEDVLQQADEMYADSTSQQDSLGMHTDSLK